VSPREREENGIGVAADPAPYPQRLSRPSPIPGKAGPLPARPGGYLGFDSVLGAPSLDETLDLANDQVGLVIVDVVVALLCHQVLAEEREEATP